VAGGNLGLRDILAALQWVRHNIAAFGGDPSRVTMLGHDTGAALVNVLLISSAAKGISEGLIYSALNGRQRRALGRVIAVYVPLDQMTGTPCFAFGR
jgi:carboxylesterase type B